MAANGWLQAGRPSALRSRLGQRWLHPVSALVLIVAVQLAVALFSLQVLTGVRAYVAGESLYSKGQKEAVLHLKAYLREGHAADYASFLRSIEVPVGDRVAREALQRRPPDLVRARQGLLQGGNDPEDFDALIRLFLYGGELPPMKRAIATWTAGDAAVEELIAVAASVHVRQVSGSVDQAFVQAAGSRIQALNDRLAVLEADFSRQLGEAARAAQQVLLGLHAAVAACLVLLGTWYVREVARQQAAKEDLIRAGRERLRDILESTEEGIVGLDHDGRCTFLNRSALRLLGDPAPEAVEGQRVAERLGLGSVARGSVHAVVRSPLTGGGAVTLESWLYPSREGAVITCMDISARDAAERALRLHALRQQTLADFGRFALGLPEPEALAREAATAVCRGLEIERCVIFDVEASVPRVAAVAGLEPTSPLVEALCGGLARRLAARPLPRSRPMPPDPVTEGWPIEPASAHAPDVLEVVEPGADGVLSAIVALAGQGQQIDADAREFLSQLAMAQTICLERRRDRLQLETMAQLDALTGLPNRTLFLDRLSHTLIESRREQRQVAVLFIDIDHFKAVNDRLGHAAGDRLLVEMARRMVPTLRAGDTIGRLGGDEFAVVLAHLADPTHADVVARKIVAELGRPFALGDAELRVSASVGLAFSPDDGREAEQLLQLADRAMYEVKASGRDGFRRFDGQLQSGI